MADRSSRPSPSGRRALVTGGGSGIGGPTALALARAGAEVAVADVADGAAAQVATRIREGGGTAHSFHVDVARAESCIAAVSAAVQAMAGLDVLVNCAGVLTSGRLAETSADDWDRTMDVNVRGTFQMCKEVIPTMTGAGEGVIINLASAAGVAPIPKLAAYGASKAAVVMLTKSIALDYGASGIRANCICPGVVDTPMVRSRAPEEEHRRDMEDSARMHVLGRVAVAQEVADLICFLTSPECSFMTGSAVVFDGGFSLSAARSV